MMKHLLLFLLFAPVSIFAQSYNMTLFANLDWDGLPTRYGVQYSDCWGYTNNAGNEIAIIGLIEQIRFIDVTNPANPQSILHYTVKNAGTDVTNKSLWRDFDTFGQYIYAVADEGAQGLLVFDMSNAPDTITLASQTNTFFNRAHTLFIDQPNGRLYLAGSNNQANGIKIYDLNADPLNPPQLGIFPLNGFGGGYIHDIYVRDNIGYASHGSLQKINIYDFSNLPTITLLGSIDNYPEEGYNHSSWLDGTGTYLVMCDETIGSDVKLINVTDPGNISGDDIHTFYSELLGAGVPGSSVSHNPYIVGNLAYVSYYEDGVQVFNISDPTNITSYAYYDTYPANVQYNGFEGCWGVYPFFPSGTLLGSDMNYGLYIMEITDLALDIDFISFLATRKKEGVQLDWIVGDVSNGNKFEVKRSADGGVTFETIGIVDLKGLQSKYTFLDQNATPRHRYTYRIDFVEYDNRRVASTIRNITAGIGETTLKVVSPINSTLIVDIQKPIEEIELGLYDIEGKKIWSDKVIEPGARLERHIDGLISGQYLLTANWPGGNENTLIQVIN
ncbi:MAG: choice-of-anchor B family protein [Saprospiraceae bacterium]